MEPQVESQERRYPLDASGLRFTGANLTRVQLNWAELSDTVFADTDLSQTIGLDECEHLGPSIIDRRTLLRSGTLPSSFLLGCGLFPWEVEAAKLYRTDLVQDEISSVASEVARIRREQPLQRYSCFISFADEDLEFVTLLLKDLRDNGMPCWDYKTSAKGGQDLWEQITKQIELRDKTIVVCSKASLKSEQVIREIVRALSREAQLAAKGEKAQVLFPIAVDDAIFKWEHHLQVDVARKFIPDFRDWRNEHGWRRAFDRLLSDLRRDVDNTA